MSCVSSQVTISPLGILFLCLDIFSLYQCQDREWSCISLLGDIDFDFVSTFSVGFSNDDTVCIFGGFHVIVLLRPITNDVYLDICLLSMSFCNHLII